MKKDKRSVENTGLNLSHLGRRFCFTVTWKRKVNKSHTVFEEGYPKEGFKRARQDRKGLRVVVKKWFMLWIRYATKCNN